MKKIFLISIWLYVLFLIFLKTNPIISSNNLQGSTIQSIELGKEIINIIPFKTIIRYLINFEHYNLPTIFTKLILNMLLYVPLGVLIKLLLCNKKKIIIIGIFISFNIELIKFISLTGYLDIDTIILNTLGFVLGNGIIYLINIPNKKLKKV